jgi:uncharacterized protein YqfB (UPF0267 family)
MIATKAEIKTLLNNTSMAQDEQIDMLLPVIESDIREYCNNGFRDKDVYIASGEISFTHNAGSADTINLDIGTNENGFVESQFKAGQTVQVQGSYNNDYFFEIESVSSTAMTLYTPAKRPYFPVLVTEDEDTLVLIYKVVYPSALKNIEAQMLNYKLSNRDYGVSAETVARYSVTYNTDFINGYPGSIMSGLNRWRRPVLV